MAATTAALSPSAVVSIGNSTKTQKGLPKVVYIRGLNSYGGLKAHNNVVSLGMPLSIEQCFVNVINSIKAVSNVKGKGKGKGGGALSSKCTKIEEIFTIAATLNVLVLIGVAVGFVLLRIEAFVEETAD